MKGIHLSKNSSKLHQLKKLKLHFPRIRRGPQERYEVEGEEVPLRRFEAALNYAQAKLVEDSCNREVRPGAMAVDVTAKSVVCRIERPSNRDLTLVDLPG